MGIISANDTYAMLTCAILEGKSILLQSPRVGMGVMVGGEVAMPGGRRKARLQVWNALICNINNDKMDREQLVSPRAKAFSNHYFICICICILFVFLFVFVATHEVGIIPIFPK